MNANTPRNACLVAVHCVALALASSSAFARPVDGATSAPRLERRGLNPQPLPPRALSVVAAHDLR